MSYECIVFDITVKNRVNEGEELYSFQPKKIDSYLLDSFLQRLIKYEYRLTNTTSDSKVYIRNLDCGIIKAEVFDNQISFSTTDREENILFELLQDASELSDSEQLILYDLQIEEWSK